MGEVDSVEVVGFQSSVRHKVTVRIEEEGRAVVACSAVEHFH
jgi:hypothetical protein